MISPWWRSCPPLSPKVKGRWTLRVQMDVTKPSLHSARLSNMDAPLVSSFSAVDDVWVLQVYWPFLHLLVAFTAAVKSPVRLPLLAPDKQSWCAREFRRGEPCRRRASRLENSNIIRHVSDHLLVLFQGLQMNRWTSEHVEKTVSRSFPTVFYWQKLRNPWAGWMFGVRPTWLQGGDAWSECRV